MSNTNGQQPAFPVSTGNGSGYVKGGLNLRQYFAGLAMQGMLASMNGFDGEEQFIAHVARVSVNYSDALLTELSKPTSNG